MAERGRSIMRQSWRAGFKFPPKQLFWNLFASVEVVWTCEGRMKQKKCLGDSLRRHHLNLERMLVVERAVQYGATHTRCIQLRLIAVCQAPAFSIHLWSGFSAPQMATWRNTQGKNHVCGGKQGCGANSRNRNRKLQLQNVSRTAFFNPKQTVIPSPLCGTGSKSLAQTGCEMTHGEEKQGVGDKEWTLKEGLWAVY